MNDQFPPSTRTPDALAKRDTPDNRCPRCRRPRVDPMTLNSTPADPLQCYHRETDNDPYCRMIRADLPHSVDRLRALASLALTLAEQTAHARAAIEEITAELWPDGDTDHEWTGDTLPAIAEILASHGLKP